ncbi:MAG: 16S rRNA (cytidine(1402)-2'-O)-methyltransferase [Paracoccaceae bacterium]
MSNVMSATPESKRNASGADGRGAGFRRAGPSARPALEPGLYLVATPIGNAADISLRALDVLARADAIAAEDTRRTRKLMTIHGIPLGGRPMVSYHDRNGAERRPGILAWLREGKSVAYCPDAGTPLVADPGYRLAEAALAEGLGLTAVPGASAVLTALALAGLPSDRFLFAGFLPPKRAARKSALDELAAVPATLVFYESPRRLAGALADMAEVLGGARPAAVARELTKKFEQVRRAPLGELAHQYAAGDAPKGEVVVLVGPPDPATAQAESAAALDDELASALATLSVKDAAREVAQRLGLPRREVYARALELADR